MALADGLVGYWSPWLGSSGYRLLDRTAYANHGSLVNMDAGTDWLGTTIQGRSGYALDFDGVNDYVTLGTNDLFAFSGQSPMSVCAWMVPLGTGSFKRIIRRRCTSGLNNRGWQLAYGFGTDRFYFLRGQTNGTNSVLNSSVTPVAGKIYHVIGTYDGATMKIYVSGLLTGTLASTLTISTLGTTTEIARHEDTTTYSSQQNLEISLYNRALTYSEANQLFQLGPGWYRPYQKRSIGYAALAGFKAYWHRRETQIIGGGLR